MTFKLTNSKTTLIILVIIFSTINLYSQKVNIYGTLPSYANYELIFYTFEDQISYQDKEIARTTVNDTGYFNFSIETDKVIKIFSYMEVFYVYMYVEPNSSYEVKFPPSTKKLPEDELNPYFKEFITPAAIVGYKSNNNTPKDKETNLLIKIFNDSFLSYYRKYITNISNNANINLIENDIKIMKEKFPASDNEFFNNYTTYKYGALKYLADKNNISAIIKEYFSDKPILYENPAYMELFNEMFNNYFSKIGGTSNGRAIYENIGNEKSYDNVSATLKDNKLLKNSKLRELVIIKGLYDALYSSDFPHKSVLDVLSQAIEKSTSENIEIAKNIQTKITHLMTDYPAPDFKLFDKDSNLVSLSDFKGQYVYLNFCNSKSYTSVSDLDLLKVLNEKHSDKLKIISIAKNDDFSEINEIVKEKGYNWLFLHDGNQQDIIKDYNIQVYPTYYLIGPDGKLLFSPASPPSENFEFQLFNIMRSKGDI